MIWLWLLACGGSEPEVVDEPLPGHMAEHTERSIDARDALITADLDGAREHLAWLTTHPLPAALAESEQRVYVEALREAAAEGSKGERVDHVATAVARTARICGDCHAAMGRPVDFPATGLTVEKTGVQGHMRRHQWAMDRLWEGLVGPADASWEAGAKVLAEDPIEVAEVGGGTGEQTRASRVHELGESAANTDDRKGRTRIFGQILEQCAVCHAAVGGGGDAPEAPE